MDLIRRYSLLFTAAALAVAVAIGAIANRPAVSANAAGALARSASYFDSTVVLARNARPRGMRGDQLAIAIGYLERLRIGLGSPFRLAEEAMRDPRLDAAMSSRVAWAVLARLRRGDAYVVDPAVFEWRAAGSPGGEGTGGAHIAFIEQTIRSASDPRAGELAVRLAYLIESAKGGVLSQQVSAATQAAALIRDRALAMRDLRDLLSDANRDRVDVMTLLAERRADRGFKVEAPPLAALDPELQLEAMRAVPSLVEILDTLGREPAEPPHASRTSLLNTYFAERLASLGAERPPLAQIAVTLRTRSHVSLQATNDEVLAANAARTVATSDTARRANALALLASAVAMRTLAQDEPWFPGDRGPDATDLIAEFGLADVTFSRGVPPAWRPYYLRELASGMRDAQRVLPAMSLAGLHVRIGNDALRDSALAMHDPRSRTLQLSIASSGGTLAHELSHDLDWQAARRLYANGSGYSTDRAMREKSGALATSLRGLAEARLLRPFSETSTPNAIGRPAEMFARGADWFVASALAQLGRSNGFLSVIGDEMLTGYAAGLPTAMGVAGSDALLSAIGEMTFLPDSTREAFVEQWSNPLLVDPTLLVRRVLETPVATRGMTPSANVASSIVAETRPPICVIDDSPEMRARANVLTLAIEARAHGIAMRRAKYQNANASWANSVLGVVPWSSDQGERYRATLEAVILRELVGTMADQGLLPVIPGAFCKG